MNVKIIIPLLTIIVCAFTVVDAQVCTKKKIVYTFVNKTYSEFRRKTYRDVCGTEFCIQSSWTIVTRERAVPSRQVRITDYCCEGYMRSDDSEDESNITCTAICVPSCKNGSCKSPGQCACNPGYLPFGGTDLHNCLPSCPEGACDHGICIAPNTCECYAGYTFLNQSCQPTCSEPCYNGTCTSPDICECLPGYRKSETNICEPYCSRGCENGTCVEPETCQCNPGYHTKGNDSTIASCAPFCSEPCYNGDCVAPDTCECWSGYEKSENQNCHPHCSSRCENGSCVAPETCLCNPGWYSPPASNDSEVACKPVCSESCGNGTCIAPDTCQCFAGYKWNSTCVPVCSPGCNGGECVAPNVCECISGLEFKDDKCVPKCNRSCGNGTCVSPNECRCFSGYHNDVSKSTESSDTEAVCVPLCYNCSSACIAPHVCVVETTDTGNISLVTINDDILSDNDNSHNKTIFTTNDDNPNNRLKAAWVQENWHIVLVAVLVTVTVVVVVLVVLRRTSVYHYLKGRSYMVEDTSLIDCNSSNNRHDNISFLNLKRNDLIN